LKLAILLAAVILLICCSAQPPGALPPQNQTILREMSADTHATWIPSRLQTDVALLHIFKYLKSLQTQQSQGGRHDASSDLDHIIRLFGEYKVQFVGIGRGVIFCNFLKAPNSDLSNWRTDFILVFDGGPNFWQISYDAESGECMSFMINGYS
jgi:hypothetical protein